MEVGVLGEDESLSASQGAFALRRLQHLIDQWAADRLTLAIQTRTQFTLISGTSTVTLGPAPADVVMQRPVWLDTAMFIVPGSSPPVESPIAIMNRDQYADVRIKTLSSQLPAQCFLQTSLDTPVASLFFWPRVSQNVEIALYCPTALDVPASLNSIITGPPGFQEGLRYALAIRLCSPFGVQPEPLLLDLAQKSYAAMRRRQVQPGLLGTDPAVTHWSRAGAYDVLTNTGG